MAEIIPFEPDTDNAGVGSGKTKTVIGAIPYEGKRKGMAFLMRPQLRKRSAAELVSRIIPEAIVTLAENKWSEVRSARGTIPPT